MNNSNFLITFSHLEWTPLPTWFQMCCFDHFWHIIIRITYGIITKFKFILMQCLFVLSIFCPCVCLVRTGFAKALKALMNIEGILYIVGSVLLSFRHFFHIFISLFYIIQRNSHDFSSQSINAIPLIAK